MADLARTRREPLIATTPDLRPLPPAARHILRGGPRVRLIAENTLKVPVPASACRAGVQDERAALWLGPDEWLLICGEQAGNGTAAALGAALAELPHSLVDVSHRQVALELAGPRAETLLAAGCPLDLHISAFPVGMCTRSVLGKAEVVLWRTAAQVFRIEVWRSFASYLTGFLEEAGRGID